jgi:hypothetical protein
VSATMSDGLPSPAAARFDATEDVIQKLDLPDELYVSITSGLRDLLFRRWRS